MSVLLETNNLSKHFDGLVANQDINFSLEAGSIRLSLIHI